MKTTQDDVPDATAVERFDRAYRGLRAAQRKTARGEGGISTAITEANHRATCESLLGHVNEKRREQYRVAVN